MPPQGPNDRRVLALHVRPESGHHDPSWVTFIGHIKDHLWSVDLFRCESSFVDNSSRLLLCSMFPLMLGICLDFYIIVSMILSHAWWGVGLSLVLMSIFVALWFGVPYVAGPLQ